jgi:hypothetical protein
MKSNLETSLAHEASTLIDHVPNVGWKEVGRLTKGLSYLGDVSGTLVSELSREIIAELPPSVRAALKYGESVIVDTGGIDTLLNAVPRVEQNISAANIDRSLAKAGLIKPGQRYLKMGASGGVVGDDRAAELIEARLIGIKGEILNTAEMTRAAWVDENNELHITPHRSDERVLLENAMLLRKINPQENNAVFLKIKVDEDVSESLYSKIDKEAQSLGWKHYTVRGTIMGSMELLNSVIRSLPAGPLKSLQEVRTILVAENKSVEDTTYHFVGTTTNAASRYSEQWGNQKFTGNPVYSPQGHIHGRAVDGSAGGHCVAVKPKIGTTIYLIIEPAKVVQVK